MEGTREHVSVEELLVAGTRHDRIALHSKQQWDEITTPMLRPPASVIASALQVTMNAVFQTGTRLYRGDQGD